MLDGPLLAIAKAIVPILRVVSDWWARRRRGASEELRRALETKREIGDRLPAIIADTNGSAIIRELRRKDSYPDLDDSLRGISPWFEVELKGTYHRGVEFFLSVQGVLIEGDTAKPAAEWDQAGRREVFVVGRVPYAAIEGIDWEGDEFYGFTHFYCRFRPFGRGPYESYELYDVEGHDVGRRRTHHKHLEGIRWRPRRRTIVRRWRDRRSLRIMDREGGR